ncbi:MAG: nucleotidyltransferase domain-containing protein [Candidatus Moraniibacteriota bacterium]
MSKKTVRKRILAAIEKDPHKKDFRKVSIFGSYAYGKPNENSDIDILIEFTPRAKIGYFELARIQRNMQKEVQKKVDLLTPGAISEFFRKEVLIKAEKIYEKR